MDELHPQLAALKREIDDATARAKQLVERLDEAAFAKRPAEGSWSPAECIAHLSLTTRAFLPLIDNALATSPRGAVDSAKRYRKDLFGWLLGKIMEPPVRMKVKAPAPFVPHVSSSRVEVLREFEELQAELARRVESANGYDIGRVRVRSPFSTSMSYNLIAALAVIPAHERRHLRQAERGNS
jgi:hypothetical protein